MAISALLTTLAGSTIAGDGSAERRNAVANDSHVSTMSKEAFSWREIEVVCEI